MLSVLEIRRIITEWRTRLQRVNAILNPPTWTKEEWRQFSQGVTVLIIDHGRSWVIDDHTYWDQRWFLNDGGELIAQVEHIPGEKTTLIVAQQGGFVQEVESYTWLWAEFDTAGEFVRDPYWIDGTWKEALYTLLLPMQQQAGFYLQQPAPTPDSLVLENGARPNDGQTPQLGWQANS